MTYAYALSIIAAAIHVVAFTIYINDMLAKRTQPCTATLAIWAFGSFLALLTYDAVTQDWVKETVAYTDVIGCIVLFIIAWRKKILPNVDKTDYYIIVTDIIAIAVWQIFHSATHAYLVFQASAALSVIPTYRKVWKEPNSENVLVWSLWGTAYFISAIVVILRWTKWEDMVFPINYALFHYATAAICLWRRK